MSETPKPRTFVASNGFIYPVGPCGYIPKSALKRRLFSEKKHPEHGPCTKGRKKRRKKFGGCR